MDAAPLRPRGVVHSGEVRPQHQNRTLPGASIVTERERQLAPRSQSGPSEPDQSKLDPLKFVKLGAGGFGYCLSVASYSCTAFRANARINGSMPLRLRSS